MNNEEMKVESTEKVEEQPAQVNIEAPIENPATNAPEQVISKGEERYNAIVQTVGKAREKVSSWIKNGVSRFGKFVKEKSISALNAPEKIAAANQLASEKTEQAGVWMGNKIAATGDFIGTKTEQAGNFVGEKVDQANDWVENKATSAYEFSSEKYGQVKNFVVEKAGQVGDYMKDKAALVEAVGSLVKEKTTEKLNGAKEGIVSTYGKAIEFGTKAVDSAALRCQQVKETYNKKKNAFMEAILQRKAEIQSEKLQKTLAKLQQYKQVESVGNNLAAA